MIYRLSGLCLGLLGVMALLLFGQQTAVAQPWQSKVSATLLDQLETAQTAEFLVELHAQADLRPSAPSADKTARTQLIYEQLTAVANQSQAPLRALLDQAQADYRPYWLVNAIWVRGDSELLAQLAQQTAVRHIYDNPYTSFEAPATVATPKEMADSWGVDRINAPAVWAAGITGQGIVVAGQDTGYEWDHNALRDQYRGWDGGAADHNHQWHDAIQGEMSGNGSNPCGYNSPVPCDDNSHGTHTMGTMVGDGGPGNQIGIAPSAAWISCRNMEEGAGSPQTYLECFEWFLAPTDLNGQNPRPDLAPHVINNSWSCPPSEGCNPANFDLLRQAIENLRAAGIMVVGAAGNSGPGCSTISAPLSIFEATTTVGNTSLNVSGLDMLSFSSSRGPVLVDGSGRLKPDLAAPGTTIRSAVLNDAYGFKTGTSMAAPHVAGAAALLMAAYPDLIGDVTAIERLLRETAVPVTDTQECGGWSGLSVPNPLAGHGRIDVYAAYQAHLLDLTLTAPAQVALSEPIVYTFEVTYNQAISPTSQLVLTSTLPANTSLISATPSYTLSGDTVQWTWETVAPLESVSATLVVQPTADVPLITHDDYGVQSEQAWARAGTAVTTHISDSRYIYLPFMSRP